jgi:hypothetical protein
MQIFLILVELTNFLNLFLLSLKNAILIISALLAIRGKDLRSLLNPLKLWKYVVFSFLICFEAISEQQIYKNVFD